MQALAAVVPERAIAGSEGGPFLFAAGGIHRGRPFVLNEMMVGTWGARADKDGIEGISNPAANLSNQPIEMIEAEMPIEVLRYGFVPDTGGAGRRRGGLAFERAFRFTGEAQFTLRGDRRDHPPYGVSRADSPVSRPPTSFTTRDGIESMLPTMPMTSYIARAGDVLHVTGTVGGGFGDPFAREPERVLDDVREGKVTVEAARRDYGVVLTPDQSAVDWTATDVLRQRAAARLVS